jgi:hypothetical protein
MNSITTAIPKEPEWAAKMNQSAHQCIKMNHVNQRTDL